MLVHELATQALNYLDSLNKPLPPKSDTEFYKQNERDYNALKRLNNDGLGTSKEDLLELAGNTPDKQIKVRILKEGNDYVRFECVDDKGNVLEKKKLPKDNFWNKVSRGEYNYLGQFVSFSKAKQTLWSENRYDNRTDPFWLKSAHLKTIKGTIEWYKENFLISNEAYTKLTDWAAEKEDSMTLGS